MAQWNCGAGLTPNFGLTGYKTRCLLYHGGSKEKGGDDWGGLGLEKRGRKMKGKRLKKWGENTGGIMRRQTADARREGCCSGEERFSFGTVNNSPCLSWTAFTAPFVCSDILGSLKRGEGLRGLGFQGFHWHGKGRALAQYEYEGK